MEIDICPRLFLAMLGIPERTRDHAALFLSTFVILALLPLIAYIPHFCLMQKVLGMPCLGCGVSRSLLALLRLRPAIAWAANPAGFAVAALLLFQVVARPIAIAAPEMSEFISKMSRRLGNMALTCLLVVWASRLF
jgi:hypothetical protein